MAYYLKRKTLKEGLRGRKARKMKEKMQRMFSCLAMVVFMLLGVASPMNDEGFFLTLSVKNLIFITWEGSNLRFRNSLYHLRKFYQIFGFPEKEECLKLKPFFRPILGSGLFFTKCNIFSLFSRNMIMIIRQESACSRTVERLYFCQALSVSREKNETF